MYKLLNRLYNKKISSKGLGVFRICFALNLMLEVIRIYNYRQLYFDEIPFLIPGNLDLTLILILWIVVLGFLILGLFTRVMSICNYLFIFFVINYAGGLGFEYHMDYTYLGVGFLMIFTPLSNSYSLDYFLAKNSSDTKHKESVGQQKASVLYYYSIILVGIAFVYFDSVFFKLNSLSWLNGLGIWLPASIPQVTQINSQFLLNQEFFIKFIGYFTLFFEFVFPFIFFFKRMRVPVLVIGVVLHLGIFLEFPIPYFAFGVMSIYVLLMPVGFWDRFKFSRINSLFVKAFSSVNPRRLPFKLDYFANKKVFYFVFFMLFFLQFNSTILRKINARSIKKIAHSNIVTKKIHAGIVKCSLSMIPFSSEFFGITGHGVFVDSHYKGFDKVFNLKYKGQYLPMFDSKGMPDYYLKGGTWANFNFRVNKPYVLKTENKIDALKKGLIRYSAFWAIKNNIDLNNIDFEIVMKKVKVSFEWKKDFLKSNLESPWQSAGVLKWHKKTAEVFLDVNEQ